MSAAIGRPCQHVLSSCCSPAPPLLLCGGGVGFLCARACVVVCGRCFRGGYWRGVMLGFLARHVLLRGAW